MGSPWKALILDVDGTLYSQSRIRTAILWRLFRAHMTSPALGLSTLCILRAYRNAQEKLRANPPDSEDITTAQLRLASRAIGVSANTIHACVARWMEQEPLSMLEASVHGELVRLLQKSKRQGLRLGVCSDYPADRKLAAMGIAQLFDVVVTAQDPEVQRFKPDPAGLNVVLRRLAVHKGEALYIGDRRDVDAVAASRAGISHFILNGTHNLRDLSQMVTAHVDPQWASTALEI